MKRRLNVSRVFRLIGLPFWTFIGVGLSGVFVNYVGAVLEVPISRLLNRTHLSQFWIDLLLPFTLVVLVSLAVVAIAWILGRQQDHRRRQSPGVLAIPEGKRGLILSVSRAESAMHAIEYHYRVQGKLEYVWLIPSGDQESEYFGPSSQREADVICQKCKDLEQATYEANGVRRPLEVCDFRRLVSPADAQDTYEVVNRIYRVEAHRLGLDDSDVIVDFTGGTKPMSVGMIMACLPGERSLEYVAYDPETKTMHGPFLIDYQYSAFNLIG